MKEKLLRIDLKRKNNLAAPSATTYTKEQVFLFNPPFYSNKIPNLGLHSVQTAIAMRGFSSIQIDLNIEYYNFLVKNLVLSCEEKLVAIDKKSKIIGLITAKEKLGIFPDRFFSPLQFPQKEEVFNLDDAEDVMCFAKNRKINPFYTFYDMVFHGILGKLDSAILVGISISSIHQVVPAFTLAAS